jgi:hypothetical protein
LGLFLVSQENKYSTTTPVILGTNILMELLNDYKKQYGEQFLKKAPRNGIKIP